MLGWLVVILLVLWLGGWFLNLFGGFIHIILIAAIAIWLYKIFREK